VYSADADADGDAKHGAAESQRIPDAIAAQKEPIHPA